MKAVDIAIVGGGLAGVYLADQVQQRNTSFVLLEAKAHLGGRILSASAGDLGPTWFWSHQPLIQQLVAELDIDIFEQHTQGDVLYQLGQDDIQRHAGASPLRSYRVSGGMEQLIVMLSQRLHSDDIQLSYPVTKIEKHDDGWVLYSSYNSAPPIHAKKIIFTSPPRVLLQHLSLSEWLPDELLQQMATTPTWMAAQAKFVASYSTPFWRDQGLSGDAFSQIGPMAEIHDASDNREHYALFGFLGIPASVRQQYSPEQLKQHCLHQFVALFGEDARDTQAQHLKDWSADIWVATEQDCRGQPMHPHMMLQPYQSLLDELGVYFAGSEYATTEAGYLEGALVSSRSVLSHLL